MPRLVRTYWNGEIHHAIDYRPARRQYERLGEQIAAIEITEDDAALGIDTMVRRHFPSTIEPDLSLDAYHGD